MDNVGAIAITANNKLHSRTKHIDIRHHFIRKKVEDKTVLVNYVLTANMLADFLTKPVMKDPLQSAQEQLGLVGDLKPYTLQARGGVST